MIITVSKVCVELQELPNQVLSSNSSQRFGNVKFMVAAAKKRARKTLREATAPLKHAMPRGALKMEMTFVISKRDRDFDGLSSAAKAHIDGIADGLGINDSRICSAEIQKKRGKEEKTYFIISKHE